MESGKKPRIIISACLLGNAVRYDGGHKLDVTLRDSLGKLVEWVPLCPEVEAGLSVPRESMQLVRDGSRTRLITCETRLDLTGVLELWIDRRVKQLERDRIHGFVLKARSPSCGIDDAELFATSGAPEGFGAGLFAKAVMKAFPLLPVLNEERLRDPPVREKFLECLFVTGE